MAEWACGACTLLNQASKKRCQACGSRRTVPAAEAAPPAPPARSTPDRPSSRAETSSLPESLPELSDQLLVVRTEDSQAAVAPRPERKTGKQSEVPMPRYRAVRRRSPADPPSPNLRRRSERLLDNATQSQETPGMFTQEDAICLLGMKDVPVAMETPSSAPESPDDRADGKAPEPAPPAAGGGAAAMPSSEPPRTAKRRRSKVIGSSDRPEGKESASSPVLDRAAAAAKGPPRRPPRRRPAAKAAPAAAEGRPQRKRRKTGESDGFDTEAIAKAIKMSMKTAERESRRPNAAEKAGQTRKRGRPRGSRAPPKAAAAPRAAGKARPPSSPPPTCAQAAREEPSQSEAEVPELPELRGRRIACSGLGGFEVKMAALVAARSGASVVGDVGEADVVVVGTDLDGSSNFCAKRSFKYLFAVAKGLMIVSFRYVIAAMVGERPALEDFEVRGDLRSRAEGVPRRARLAERGLFDGVTVVVNGDARSGAGPTVDEVQRILSAGGANVIGARDKAPEGHRVLALGCEPRRTGAERIDGVWVVDAVGNYRV